MTAVLKVQCEICRLVVKVTTKHAKAGKKPVLTCDCNKVIVRATVHFIEKENDE